MLSRFHEFNTLTELTRKGLDTNCFLFFFGGGGGGGGVVRRRTERFLNYSFRCAEMLAIKAGLRGEIGDRAHNLPVKSHSDDR